MHLRILTRRQASYIVPSSGPYAVISITTPGDGDAELAESERRTDVLRLSFHDIRGEVSAESGIVSFTEAMPRMVWKFVGNHHSNIETLVIHCDQGQSRSTAIGAAIDEVVIGGNGLGWFNRYPCNELVYDRLIASRHAFTDD